MHDYSEIVDAKWIDISEFLACYDIDAYNKAAVNTAISSEHTPLKLTQLN